MGWADCAERANAAFLAAWPTPALFNPKAGGGPISLTGVIDRPALLEDVLPAGSSGTSVVRFWVDFANVSPQPQNGDQLTLNGVNYDLFDVLVDPDGGGALLKLRRNQS
jgi:hypothetical protein